MILRAAFRKLPGRLGFIVTLLFSSAVAEPVQVGAYYYPWYHTDGRHWSEGYFGKSTGAGPQLGEYSSRDAETIIQHVKWSHEMGISNWICAWWGRQSWEDVTLQYRIAPVLNQVTDADKNHPVKFCVFYESEGLLGLDREKGIEFNSATTAKFLEDFGYLADTYFSHPCYLKTNGRPVVYLYLSRTFSGDYKNALRLAREAAKIRGFDIFLVGDEVYWGEPDKRRIQQFDAITAYNMHGPPAGNWTKFLAEIEAVYSKYHAVATELGVKFIPGIMPGFNSHGADPARRHYIIPRRFQNEAGEEKVFLHGMMKLSVPLLGKNFRHVAVTSFNEWHEGTQLEPSRDGELKRALYQFSTGKLPD